jgi:DNA-binding CsgD family transcriptional regulator
MLIAVAVFAGAAQMNIAVVFLVSLLAAVIGDNIGFIIGHFGGRGERKHASSGWGSLTRAELDVVKLVSESLGNKDVAARLFVSPRTVQAHLTHIYTKLGLTSRVQLAQEAARRG